MASIQKNKKDIPEGEVATLLETLEMRFANNMNRHEGLEWSAIQARLIAHTEKLRSLSEMERTGGEPDVIGVDKSTGEFIFCDCSAESPTGRRSLCYDRDGWESRKEARPESTALDMAEEMGVDVLTEEEYRHLQQFGPFDTKTSSWLKTPPFVRKLGGAIFGDFRFGRVFIYHNGAQSYYAGRGFRGILRV